MGLNRSKYTLHLPPAMKLKGYLRVRGNVTVGTLVDGGLQARRHIQVRPEGQVTGEVICQTLVAEPGSRIDAHAQIGGSHWMPMPLRKLLNFLG